MVLARKAIRELETDSHCADYAQYHEDALKNAANILEKAGQIKGPQKEPYSFQSFEVNGAQKHMEM